MDLVSSCGLPAASVVWQSATGAWALTAVCKATFRLVPGVAKLAQAQEPPNESDEYWNDDESRSMQAASDLVPFKPRADVLVVGHAFAPQGAKVRSLLVRVCAGAVDKSLEVWCERSFELDGRVREGAPFFKMPLRHERAAGGPDTSNPAGLPFDGVPDAYGRIPIANLQPTGTFLSFRGDTFAPVGLGPIAPHWPERVARLYHRASRDWHRRWNARPLPEQLAPDYFNAAPRDQQTDFLHPDEQIVLENLHVEHPRLVTRLPGLSPQAIVERATGHRAAMDLVADTLWIDTDRALCTVVWRGRIGLVDPHEQGRISFTCQELTEQMFEVQPPPSAALRSPGQAAMHVAAEAPDATMTLAPGLEKVARAALPFETSRWVQSPMATPSLEPRVTPVTEEVGETVFLLPTADSAVTLPFARTGGVPEPSAPPPSPPPRPVEVSRAVPAAGVSPLFALGATAPGAAPLARLALGAEETQQAGLVAVTVPEAPPAPPPMIGPLATAEMGAKAAPAEEGPASAPTVDATPLIAEAPAAPAIEDYPIERCARIAARLACNPEGERAAEVLRAEGLDASGWKSMHEHWLAAIRAKAERRDKTLMAEYDRAYVSELEAQRGVIALEDYARLAEAAERGAQGQALAARGLPSSAWANVHRVWIERMIKDPPLAGLVRRAMAVQREAR